MALNQTKNFAKVTVLNPYGSGDTSIVLQTGQGAKLPTGTPFNVVWWNSTDYADPSDDPNVEVVRVTNIATDTLTVTRAQEGTSASTKNTSGKTYKMIAGLTAKGPESLQLGSGANASASYTADIRQATAANGQIHTTDHDADDGGYSHAFHGTAYYHAMGAFFNGANWVAKETTASIIRIDSTQTTIFYHNTGLTVGNTFTPTEVARFDASGNLGLTGVGAPNVALDSLGADAFRASTVTLVNGANQNVNIGAAGLIRVTGPTAAFSIGGFTGGADGRRLRVINDGIAFAMTINNADAGSSAVNRISTFGQGNVAVGTTGGGTADFVYDAAITNWTLVGHQP